MISPLILALVPIIILLESSQAIPLEKIRSQSSLQFPVKSKVFAGKVKFSANDAMKYLTRYGYLPSQKSGFTVSREEFSEALLKFQKLRGMPETGELDDPTQTKMLQPRCGVPDLDPSQTMELEKPRKYKDLIKNKKIRKHLRPKRYVLQGGRLFGREDGSSKYPVISYRMVKYGTIKQLRDRHNKRWQDRVIDRAFKTWQKHVPLQFTRTDREDPDLPIYFYEYDHGDNQPFDGSGGSLAHASYPTEPSDDIHFDNSEPWGPEGRNLLWVAVHEIGHSLGLRHSHNEGAVMRAEYGGRFMDDVVLHQDDIDGIHSIYGRRDGRKQVPVSRFGKSLYRAESEETSETESETDVTDGLEPSEPFNRGPENRVASSPAFTSTTTQAPTTTTVTVKPKSTSTTRRGTTKTSRRSRNRTTRKPTTRAPTRRSKSTRRQSTTRRAQKTTTRRRSMTRPEICDGVDSMTTLEDGTLVVFKGKKYWLVNPRTKKIKRGYPRKLAEDWGMRYPINAAIVDPDNQIYAFSNHAIYEMDLAYREEPEEYPPIKHYYASTLNTYRDVANKPIDAALFIPGNPSARNPERAFFFLQSKYWIDRDLDGRRDESFARSINEIDRKLRSVDAAVSLRERQYLFSGDQYYEVRQMRKQLKVRSRRYPRKIADDWFGCR